MTADAVRQLFERAAPALAAAWAGDLRHMVRSGYDLRPEDDVRATCERGLAALLTYLELHDRAPVDAFVREEVAVRVGQGFTLADVLRAVMQLQVTVGAWLGEQRLPAAVAWEVAQSADAFVRTAVAMIGDAFEEETIRREQQLRSEIRGLTRAGRPRDEPGDARASFGLFSAPPAPPQAPAAEAPPPGAPDAPGGPALPPAAPARSEEPIREAAVAVESPPGPAPAPAVEAAATQIQPATNGSASEAPAREPPPPAADAPVPAPPAAPAEAPPAAPEPPAIVTPEPVAAPPEPVVATEPAAASWPAAAPEPAVPGEAPFADASDDRDAALDDVVAESDEIDDLVPLALPEIPVRDPVGLPSRMTEVLGAISRLAQSEHGVLAWLHPDGSVVAWSVRTTVAIARVPADAAWLALWRGEHADWSPAAALGLPAAGWRVAALGDDGGVLALRGGPEPWMGATTEYLAPLAGQILRDEQVVVDARRLVDELLAVVAEAVDTKAGFSRGHSLRVAVLASRIAEAMGLDARTVRLVRNAAFLHDIGKVGVSERILNKKEALTRGERTILALHAERGARLLARRPSLAHLAPTALHVSTRYDGLPTRRVARDAIPIGARIIAVADAYDAMTSPRPHRPARPRDQAIDELRRGAGTQFDPAVVTALVAVLSGRAAGSA